MSLIRALHQQLVNKDRSAVELTQASLDRIAAVDGQVKSFLTVTADQAIAKAQHIDAQIAAGETIGLLAGIPIAIKDNLCTKAVQTTCASQILAGFVPPYESTVTSKLQIAGAVMVG
ncbi:MAG: amidase family protein, partial [Synechocystis sp.]|nr:amidase family protein [Synechocystis sp.]